MLTLALWKERMNFGKHPVSETHNQSLKIFTDLLIKYCYPNRYWIHSIYCIVIDFKFIILFIINLPYNNFLKLISSHYSHTIYLAIKHELTSATTP
jgi:hypothetical protein